MKQNTIEKRCETRIELTSYHCVEVKTLKTHVTYQFKIWNISPHGMCLLVHHTSKFLKRISVGEMIKVQYYPSDLSWPPDVHQTQIRHISKANDQRFKDHFFVGLMVV